MHRLPIVIAVATALASTACTHLLTGSRSRPDTASPTSSSAVLEDEGEAGAAQPERQQPAVATAGDCSTLDQRFASLQEDPVRGCGWGCSESEAKRVDDAVHAFAQQYATCKQYAGLFERVAARAAGPAALGALEARGVPVEQAFVEYLTTHRGSAFLRVEAPADAMWGVTQWLVKQRHMSHCPALATALEGASADAHGGAAYYFSKTRCPQALPRVVVALGSKEYRYRRAACEVLGQIGDASVLPRLQQVATRDPFSYGIESDAELAREEGAWDAVDDAEGDEEAEDDATMDAIEAGERSRANAKAHYPVRQACAEAHRALSKRLGRGKAPAKAGPKRSRR